MERVRLLGGEVAGVDEQEFAGVKADRPPPGGAHKLVLPDPNRVTADFTEIIDHDSAPFSVRSRVHPHTRINRNAICGNVVVARSLGHTLEARGEHPNKWRFNPTSWIFAMAMRSRLLGFPGSAWPARPVSRVRANAVHKDMNREAGVRM
jgi:hypothetical protein